MATSDSSLVTHWSVVYVPTMAQSLWAYCGVYSVIHWLRVCGPLYSVICGSLVCDLWANHTL